MDDMPDFLEELDREVLAPIRERLRRRRNHPYVSDLIEILRPYGDSGLSRVKVIEQVERRRIENGLPIPRKFDETVQSAFNAHNTSAATFEGLPRDGLFSSVRDGNHAIWVVHVEMANSWLLARTEIS
jgi:hypothetical protein